MERVADNNVLDSPAVAVLCALEQDGFRVVLTDDGLLTITPKSKLTPDRMRAITECRESLRALVRCCDSGVRDRRRAFAEQAQIGGPFVYRPVPYAPGVCHSCGDLLSRPVFGSCWRCMLARRLACAAPVPADITAYDEARVVA